MSSLPIPLTFPITTDTLVADALEQVPGALDLFIAHGVDPTCDCGISTRVVTLAEAERRCGLRDVEGLAAELNARLQALEAEEVWPLEEGPTDASCTTDTATQA